MRVRDNFTPLHLETTLSSILHRIQNGDQSAAEDCVAEYGGLIWRLARRYLDRAESEVEDAVQDVFLELWLHADRFDPSKGSEAAFVATLAHRRIIDRQRKITSQRRNERRASNELKATELKIPNISGDEAGIKQAPMYRKELARGFNELPKDEQTALWMSVYRGLSHRDISEMTDVPVGTVKSRIRRAMIRMTKAILGDSNELQCERSPS
tara:strand:+ start:139 stop:771 length:633 start_codon:yes stop_codon:yes gene_type:complete